MGLIDNIINECDIALKTLSNKKPGTNRDYPAENIQDQKQELSKEEKNLSIQMMRVNLAGEVAAQALYRGQAMVCKDEEIKKHLIEAGEEETDHLIWCKKRLDELDGNASVFNPIWYAGSFAIGAIFGNMGEKVSLGFVEETEKQVVKHIDKHHCEGKTDVANHWSNKVSIISVAGCVIFIRFICLVQSGCNCNNSFLPC